MTLSQIAQDMPQNTQSTLSGHDLRSGADWLACAAPETQAQFLASLSDHEAAALPWLFEFWAFDHQLPPEGDWRTWVIMGGRGAGKTRAGSEWVRAQVEGNLPMDEGRARRVALVGETFDQVRDIMVFGESGIIACSPPDRRPEWNAGRKRLEWQNGAIAEAHSASSPEGLRGPQFDAAWVDEIGCGAVDKGPNQPNKFKDEKSSESGLPHFSSGRRDDLVQMQYLRAYFSFFAEPENNPVSEVYDGPMVDMSKAFVWAWDARPWPDFPNNLAQWSDGTNYLTGHWLNGRSGVQHLAHVVADLCEAAGVTSYDVSGLEGVVRGFAITEADTIRAALQPLMLAYGFDAIENAGRLVFRNRQHAPALDVAGHEVVLEGDDPRIESVRLPEPETTGDVLLGYVEAEGAFEASVAQARFADDISTDRAQTELPLALSRGEAATISERWLSEARVARDMVQLSLPPSRYDVRAGDLIRLEDADHLETLYRVDRIEDRGARALEAVRVERQIYVPSDAVESNISPRPFAVPVPVAAQFMDLPLLRGTEVPHAPHLAVSAQPWPGSIAAFDASEDAGYGLNTVIEVPSVMGVTLNALEAARAGQWSNGGLLRVKLAYGALSSAGRNGVLAGANAAALGDGSSDLWEIFQFSQAELVAPDTYDLGVFLRGQAGSDGVMPQIWPEGSRFVLLNGAPEQIDLDLNVRDLARHYRVGPALRPYDDPSYRHYIEAFKGVGLRPYRPAHLRARLQGGDLLFSWIRRTRIDGDNWNGVEVPLGEEAESYLIRVSAGGSVVREVITQTPEWTYSAALRQSDLGASAFSLEAAQLSMSFGPGPFARIDIND